MSCFWKMLRWAVIVYLAAWMGTLLRFWVLALFAFAFAIHSLTPKTHEWSSRKPWIAFGILATALNGGLTWESWRLYRIQNDAPMGLIPDLNALVCLVADVLLIGLIFGIATLLGRSRRSKKAWKASSSESVISVTSIDR